MKTPPEHYSDLINYYAKRRPDKVARILTARFSGIPISQEARLNTGDIMRVVLPDTPSSYLYLTGDYEPGLTTIMCNMLRQGDVLWNVGAHIGTRGLQSSRVIGQNGLVYAFEPTPRTREYLKYNLSSIKPNVVIGGMALGSNMGQATLYDYGWTYSGCNSVNTEHTIQRGRITRVPTPRQLSVPMETVDNLVRTGYRPPSGMVIDAEGYEGQILEGSTETISKYKPPIIFEDGNQGPEFPNGGVGVLARQGYSFWDISHDATLERLCEVSGSNPMQRQLRNILAVHPLNDRGMRLP